MTSAGSKRKWTLFILATLVPMIPMMYLYQKNADYILFSHIMVVTSVMTIVSAIIYGTLLSLYKNITSAFTGTIIAWVVFFGYGIIYNNVNPLGIRHRHLLPITFAVAVAVLLLMKRIALKYKASSNSGNPVISITCMFISVLLLWNTGGALLVFRNIRKFDDSKNDLIKTDFYIDDSITNLPNIYWIHCDGMLGFDPMEEYFGDPQTEFSQFLTDNGFMINRHANFEAGHTTIRAIPTLMCPGYYDAVVEGINQGVSADRLLNATMLSIARMKNETVQAFADKEYKTVLISPIDETFLPVTDIVYDLNDSQPSITSSSLQKDNIEDLLKDIKILTSVRYLYIILKDSTMLSAADAAIGKYTAEKYKYVSMGQYAEIPEYTEEVAKIQEKDVVNPDSYGVIRCLLDSRNIEGPKFVLVNFLMAHRPFIYDENGNPNRNDIDAPESYPAHHRYTAKILKNAVGAILEREPDAVIVLQADHGLHGITREQILRSFDGSEASVTDIWNGVMSAVRIPEQYGTPDEILEPLDISRYIVNNYVGYNYKYLDYHG